MIEFFAPGIPAPKGSMRAIAFRRKNGKLGTSVKHDNAKTRPWMAVVSDAAAGAMGTAQPLDCAVGVYAWFYLPRPKSHVGKRGVRPSAPRYPETKPDADKLMRCVLDAMEGVAFVNDSRVVEIKALKLYADHHQPGVRVLLVPCAFEHRVFSGEE